MSFWEKKIEKQLDQYQRELIETHYQEVENMYRQMRGWRHDYRNHIQAMKAYAASGDLNAIRAYLDMLDTDLSTVDTVVKSGCVDYLYHGILRLHCGRVWSRGAALSDEALKSGFEKELDERFLRVGRAMIVNLNQVRRVTRKEVILSDGAALPLPRGAYESLNRAIITRT